VRADVGRPSLQRQPVISIQPHLTQLESAGLVRVGAVEPELLYLFRHGLIQDAAYSTLLRGQRRSWHAATADVLQSACRSEAEVIAAAPILATHFLLADNHPRALHFLTIAADSAFEHYANTEAAAFYAQALEIATGPESDCDARLLRRLFERHGRSLELTSHFELALDNYRAMEATAQKLGDKSLQLAAIMARATIHATANMAQNLPQAASLLEHASALADDLGDPVAEAKINWTLMLNNSMSGGDATQSLAYGQHALELARSRNERELIALVLMDMWFALGSSGRWDDAAAALHESYAIAREVGNFSIAAESLCRLALNNLVAGRYDDCLAVTAEAAKVADLHNSDDARALARMPLCIVHTDRGDLDRAITLTEEAIHFGELSGNVTILIGTRGDLARAYGLLGDLEHGLALTRQAAQDAQFFPLISAWPGSVTILLYLRQGDLSRAAATLAELPDYRDLMHRAGFVPMMWTSLGLREVELALARADWATALARARELLAHFEQMGVVYARPEARLLLGQAHLALGQFDEALAALQTARAEAERLGSRRVLWPILAALAEIASARGQAEAGALRQQARQIVDYIATHVPTPALRQSFLARADVQSVLRAAA
jgi:tetratricopeptide (TPR) repeat protein